MLVLNLIRTITKSTYKFIIDFSFKTITIITIITCYLLYHFNPHESQNDTWFAKYY